MNDPENKLIVMSIRSWMLLKEKIMHDVNDHENVRRMEEAGVSSADFIGGAKVALDSATHILELASEMTSEKIEEGKTHEREQRHGLN